MFSLCASAGPIPEQVFKDAIKRICPMINFFFSSLHDEDIIDLEGLEKRFDKIKTDIEKSNRSMDINITDQGLFIIKFDLSSDYTKYKCEYEIRIAVNGKINFQICEDATAALYKPFTTLEKDNQTIFFWEKICSLSIKGGESEIHKIFQEAKNDLKELIDFLDDNFQRTKVNNTNTILELLKKRFRVFGVEVDKQKIVIACDAVSNSFSCEYKITVNNLFKSTGCFSSSQAALIKRKITENFEQSYNEQPETFSCFWKEKGESVASIIMTVLSPPSAASSFVGKNNEKNDESFLISTGEKKEEEKTDGQKQPSEIQTPYFSGKNKLLPQPGSKKKIYTDKEVERLFRLKEYGQNKEAPPTGSCFLCNAKSPVNQSEAESSDLDRTLIKKEGKKCEIY